MRPKAQRALEEAIEVALNRVQRRIDKADLAVDFGQIREIVETLLWDEIHERFLFDPQE